ncbi:MAG: integrase core domain-containing protein, partial [Acidobacteriota bacterium]
LLRGLWRRHGVAAGWDCADLIGARGAVAVYGTTAETCRRLGLAVKKTRPYTPRTNGKAERFIQTLSRTWAYGRFYRTSAQRRRALAPWLRRYNERRPHHGIGGLTPLQRPEMS